MKKTLLLFGISSILLSCGDGSKEFNGKLKTENDTISYALGISIGGSFKQAGLENVNLDIFKIAIENAVSGDSNMLIKIEDAQKVIQDYMKKTQEAKIKEDNTENITKNEQFLEENKKKEGIKTTPSGLQYKIINEVEGKNPTPTDVVSVHYTGTTIDGKVFDSSVEKGEPLKIQLSRVIKGWTEGLQLMSVGSKYKFFIPQDLAYGAANNNPNIPPYSTLIFEVELLEIVKNKK